MSLEIKTATRTGVKPLIGLYGKSGSGKSLSSLLMARGLVGPKGKIRLVDSESGRGSLFADIVPGGYEVIDLEPPFSPARYEEAIGLAEKDADAVVIDSLTHEWSGEGGVLDWQEAELDRMAGDNWGKREACKMASWIKPKLAHKMMVMRLLRCKCALICCLRGEEKTHMDKGEDGKNKVITDKFSSPLFDPRFIFEMLLSLETIAINGEGGFVIPRKITHPSVRSILPKDGQQIGIAFGEALARWCAATGDSKPANPANFDALRQAADGKTDAVTVLNEVTIADVKTVVYPKQGTVYWITLNNGMQCATPDKKIADRIIPEIGSGLTFTAKVIAGHSENKFKLVELEPMDLVP